MIYITGDTHGLGDIEKLYKLDSVDPTDFIIILGDVGICWYGPNSIHDKQIVEFFKSLPCPVLWLDGNHENFDLIEQLPITEWHGGKVQIIANKIIHLMRGEIYEIDGKTFFCFGGGLSIDKSRRVEGISWWPQEMPSDKEYQNGLYNIKKHNYKVDYILTHTAPNFICKQLVSKMFSGEELLQNYLENVSKTVQFKKWFFGHWHFDRQIDNYYAVYNDIHSIR